MTALDVRDRLTDLHAERALALAEGIGNASAYMVDLDEEIAAVRRVWVLAAVGEVATLRAELFGPQVG
jgi:hypothetical protein